MSASRAGGRAHRVRRSLDPRHLVVAGGLLALLVVGATALVMAGVADRARESVAYVRTSIEVPLSHLSLARRANVNGANLLQQAVVTTGDERNVLLTEAISAADVGTEAWTSYRAVALPLEGEAELAARYARDLAVSVSLSTDTMVPLVQSDEIGVLPAEQLLASDTNRLNLNALIELYEHERDVALDSVDRRLATATHFLFIAAGVVAGAVLIAALVALRMASRVVTARRGRAAAADLAEFEARLMRALELVDDDAGAFRVATKAAVEVMPDVTVSVVATADIPSAFTTVVGTSACGVDTTDRCPALRAGSLLEFRDSTALDACPVLALAGREPCSISCMPVSVAGRQVAIVQALGPVDQPPEMGAAGRLVIRRVGERITMLRAFARSEHQASRDPLTGLHNRRSLEATVAELTEEGVPYSVAFADLDHFKRLNDTFGHDAGDQALRAFALTLRNGLRPEDLSCRWGGEEFIVVLPRCDERHTVHTMNRVRALLATASLDGSTTVTVSVGVAGHRPSETFGETIGRADAALRQAKASGRDRVILWEADPTDEESTTVLAGARGR